MRELGTAQMKKETVGAARLSVALILGACTTACSAGEYVGDSSPNRGLAPEHKYLPRTARVHRQVDPVGQTRALSTTAETAAPAIARAFLVEQGADPAMLDDLRPVTVAEGSSGVVHTRMQQVIDGRTVFGAQVRVSVRGDEIVSVIENASRSHKGTLLADIDAAEALEAALAHLHPDMSADLSVVDEAGLTVTFARGDLLEPPKVESVWIPTLGDELREGYAVQVWDRDNTLRYVLVGGDGQIEYVQERTAADSYMAYPFGKHPDNSDPMIIAGPGAGAGASPAGWVDEDATFGNNVDAFLDRDGDDAPDAEGHPKAAGADFEFDHDPAASPSDGDNPFAAAVNAFYVVNELHDRLYGYGFTEAAGNFQNDNFGLGGQGADAISLHVQDAVETGALNNANFATPPDGEAPRMQMYIWDLSDPRRDSSFDADILIHEVGHGVSWRMVGDMDVRYPLTGAVGEGYADALALLFTADPVVGEYAAADPDGIRRERYDNYTGSYGDIGNGALEVHNDGEVIGAAFWKLRESWLASGLSMDKLLTLSIEGLHYTPPRPTHEQFRDGLLEASGDAAADCLIWEAFAAYGMGVGAEGAQGCDLFFNCTASVTESFDVPVECGGSSGDDDDDDDDDDDGPGDDGPGDDGPGDDGPGDDGPGDDGPGDDDDDDDGPGDDGPEPDDCADELAFCDELMLPEIGCKALFPECF